MNSATETAVEPSLAKTLAPEDVRVGDYLAVLDRIAEFPSFLWFCDSGWMDSDDLKRIRFRARDSGTPLRVQQVCLPFVFVRPPKGKPRTLDLRACTVARLDNAYGAAVWNALSGPKKAKKSGADHSFEFEI